MCVCLYICPLYTYVYVFVCVFIYFYIYVKYYTFMYVSAQQPMGFPRIGHLAQLLTSSASHNTESLSFQN